MTLWFLENTSTFKQKEISKEIFRQYQSPKWAEELMVLNCGVGEDSWESLGLQGDPTSPF